MNLFNLGSRVATPWFIPAATKQFQLYPPWLTSITARVNARVLAIRFRSSLSKISNSLAPKRIRTPSVAFIDFVHNMLFI